MPAVAIAAAAPAFAASAGPDLTVVTTASATTFTTGVPITYSYAVSNVGVAATDGTTPVSVTITRPSAGGTFTPSAPAEWTLSSSTASEFTYTWTGAPLAPGASAPVITATFTPACSTGDGTSTAAVAPGSGGESNTGNNTSSVTPTKVLPDLTVSVAASGTAYTFGTPFPVTYTVRNVGDGPTNGTLMRIAFSKTVFGTLDPDTVPSGWTLQSQNSSSMIYSSTSILQPGETAAFTFVYTNTDSTCGQLTAFSAIVQSGGGGECVTSNNHGSVYVPKTGC